MRAGNDEFAQAARQSLDKLRAMRRPEVDWFLTHCAPSFSLSLDEL
ncbi:MAG: HD domain-containing protein [Oscillospiraceae bacterium]|jgi:5'-deoxynucleotidase|nr:HD domain-containing protein [Oscillospiraceae bacterium]